MEKLVLRDKSRVDREERKRKAQAPAKELKLPPLLEKRRQEFLIPDGAFAAQPVFDRIWVFQIAEQSVETYGSGLLVKPEIIGERELEASPRGVLVGAGLSALDKLRSHGMELGHVVRFTHLAPFALMVDEVDGVQQWVRVMDVSYIVSSEDLETERRAGGYSVEYDATNGQHYLVRGKKALPRPQSVEKGFDE